MSPGTTLPGSGALSALLLLSAGCSFPPLVLPPSNLTYATNPAAYVLGVPVAANGPTSDGGAVASYSVEPALPAGLNLDPVTGVITGTPEVVIATTGFTVSATNAVGVETAVLFMTISATGEAPGAPTQVVAIAGIRSATLTWTAPARTGEGPITGYQVLVSPAAPAALFAITGTSAVVDGLANGTSYTFAILATSAAGPGPASLPAAPVTTPDLPSAPSNVAGVAGNGLAYLTWAAPALSGGRPVESYLILVSPAVAAAEVSVVGTTGTVSGLANGLAYTFQVVAVNAVGEGPPSALSPAVTPILSACAVDSACVGNGWCLAGSCQAPYGLTLASGLATADDGKTYVNGNVPLTVGITGGDPIVQLALVGEGNLQVVGPPAYAFAWDTSGRAEGPHLMIATAAGGTRTYSSNVLELVVDRTRPLPPTLAPMGAITTSRSVELTGTAEALALLTVLDAGVVGEQTGVTAAGRWTASLALAEGSHLLSATATDRAGNRSVASSPVALTVDWTAPPPPVIDPVASPTTTTALNLTGDAEADSTVTVSQDGVALPGTVQAIGGRWAKSLTLPGNGTFTLVATARDAAGHRSDGSAALVVEVAPAPVPAPTIEAFTATPATISVGGSATLSWSATGATSLSIDNGVGEISGSSVTVTPSSTTTYTLTASSVSGSATATAAVVVLPPVQAGWWQVAAGASHSVGVRLDGTLWAWGSNDSGQLGDGTTTQRSAPVQIGSGYASVGVGTNHAVALKADGTLWAWGSNDAGQLGDGTTTNQLSPGQIGSGYALVAAGDRHSVAVKLDGTLWAWGSNDFGQLGDGTATPHPSPVEIGGGYAVVAAGDRHSVAVKTDGTLWAWGSNDVGQLGDGTVTPQGAPVQIGSGYASVAAGSSHTLGLQADGTLWAWGANDAGQLGDGTTTPQPAPEQIGSGYGSVAAGSSHSMALRIDGTLWSWGSNDSGQLGDGTTAPQHSPVEIGSGYASVAAGDRHSVAVKTGGTLWTWGDGSSGQLGDGGGSRAIPGQVP